MNKKTLSALKQLQCHPGVVFFPLMLLLISGATRAAFSGKPEKYVVDTTMPFFIQFNHWDVAPRGGDTIYISPNRIRGMKFNNFHGDKNNPLIVINDKGLVKIDETEQMVALSFVDCTHIKITGAGHPDYKYGFELKAVNCGLDLSGLSSDIEAEFIKIDHEGFFGIMAKKDYHGDPPSPPPVFSNLVIHDCLIENVTEGMYLGETISPGMEFKQVKIYHNIVRNTGREAIQIANMVEDVEIFNNTLLFGGRGEECWQNKILQIGDNSVAKVYNNIIIGAQGSGIVSFGKGNNIFENNYISSCNGMFIDNRKFTDQDAPVIISDNFFTKMVGDKVIENMNELNFIKMTGNKWDTDVPFYKNTSGNDNNYLLENNVNQFLHPHVILESPNDGDGLPLGTPPEYENIGAPGDPVSFILIQIAAASKPNGAGSISGAGNYGYGESVTLTATPATGYTLRHWSENGNVIATAPTLSFKVTQNRSLTARFALATGINEIKGSPMHLKIYPNPAGNWLKFSLPADYQGKNIRASIVSMAGETILMKGLDTEVPWDISILSPGMYLLILKRKDENYRRFFIKK